MSWVCSLSICCKTGATLRRAKMSPGSSSTGMRFTVAVAAPVIMFVAPAPELAVDEVRDPAEKEPRGRRRRHQVRQVQEGDPGGAGEPGDREDDADHPAVARHPALPHAQDREGIGPEAPPAVVKEVGADPAAH